MTDIENKAIEYAERPANAKTWGIHKSVLTDAFLAGADYALSNQWRDPKKEKPKEGQGVLAYHRNCGNVLVYWHEYYQRWIEHTDERMSYKTDELIAWLNPTVPEDNTEGK